MQHCGLDSIRRVPELAALLEHADHVDIKTVSGSVDLHTFLANMLNYQPDWMMTLYSVRAVFVRFLGMRQKGRPRRQHLAPEDVPMQKGQRASIFKVRMSNEEQYWIAEAEDKHLNALLGVVVEPLPGQRKRFHVLTVVHYRNWAGPVYFNVIKPFHHLVVGRMALAGVGKSGAAYPDHVPVAREYLE